MHFLILEGGKHLPSKDPRQCTQPIPAPCPISFFKLSGLCLIFTLTAAVLIQGPGISYVEICKKFSFPLSAESLLSQFFLLQPVIFLKPWPPEHDNETFHYLAQSIFISYCYPPQPHPLYPSQTKYSSPTLAMLVCTSASPLPIISDHPSRLRNFLYEIPKRK